MGLIEDENNFQDKLRENQKQGVAGQPSGILDEAHDLDPDLFARELDKWHHVKFFKTKHTPSELKAMMAVGAKYVVLTGDSNVVKTTGEFIGVHRINGFAMFKIEHELETDEYTIVVDGRTRIKCEHEHPNETYMIQDTRQFVGNCILWWGPNSSGTTTNVDKAGKYSRAKATEIMMGHKDRVYIWPVRYLNNRTIRVIDMQYVSRTETRDEFGWMECAKDLMYQIASAAEMGVNPYRVLDGKVPKLPRIEDYSKEFVVKIANCIKVFIVSNDTLSNSFCFDDLYKTLKHSTIAAEEAYELKPGWRELADALSEWNNEIHKLITKDNE